MGAQHSKNCEKLVQIRLHDFLHRIEVEDEESERVATERRLVRPDQVVTGGEGEVGAQQTVRLCNECQTCACEREESA